LKVPEVAAQVGDSDEDDKAKKKRRRAADSPLSEDDGSDEDKPKRGRKKMLFNFTETEVRRFVRSFRKFAEPLSRLEAIAQDAELEEFSKSELEQLGTELLAGCRKAQSEYESTVKEEIKKPAEDGKKKQDRGAVFKFGTIDVYVRPLLKMQADLVPLNELVKSAGDVRLLQIPGHPKIQKGWDVQWEIEDDVALLKGVYRYGLGSWEAIKMDPDYGLAEKIWLKDKSKKPQGKHVQARAEYLLKYLSRYAKATERRSSVKVRASKKAHLAASSATAGSNVSFEKVLKKKMIEEKTPPVFGEVTAIFCFFLVRRQVVRDALHGIANGEININSKLRNKKRYNEVVWTPTDLLQRYRIAAKDRANHEGHTHRKHHRHHHHHHREGESSRDNGKSASGTGPSTAPREELKINTASTTAADCISARNTVDLRMGSSGHPRDPRQNRAAEHHHSFRNEPANWEENPSYIALNFSDASHRCTVKLPRHQNLPGHRYAVPLLVMLRSKRLISLLPPTFISITQTYNERSSHWERKYSESNRDRGDRDYRKEFRHAQAPQPCNSPMPRWPGPLPPPLPPGFPNQPVPPFLNGPIPNFAPICPPSGFVGTRHSFAPANDGCTSEQYVQPPPIPPRTEYAASNDPRRSSNRGDSNPSK
uniref:CDH1_2_SANT_HL1 domain-containing protein n=1 Tax=Gongylonema pulchrum TaxID=637853 RepID=A0A183DQF4_9BILA